MHPAHPLPAHRPGTAALSIRLTPSTTTPREIGADLRMIHLGDTRPTPRAGCRAALRGDTPDRQAGLSRPGPALEPATAAPHGRQRHPHPISDLSEGKTGTMEPVRLGTLAGLNGQVKGHVRGRSTTPTHDHHPPFFTDFFHLQRGTDSAWGVCTTPTQGAPAVPQVVTARRRLASCPTTQCAEQSRACRTRTIDTHLERAALSSPTPAL